MVIGGHIDAMWTQFVNAEVAEREGKIDIVASNAAKRFPTSPHIPTFRELGIDFQGATWIVISNLTADPATVRNLEATINRLLNNSEFAKSLQTSGVVVDLSAVSRSKESTIQALQQQRKFVEYVKTLK